jgi:hypothetical protein
MFIHTSMLLQYPKQTYKSINREQIVNTDKTGFIYIKTNWLKSIKVRYRFLLSRNENITMAFVPTVSYAGYFIDCCTVALISICKYRFIYLHISSILKYISITIFNT